MDWSLHLQQYAVASVVYMSKIDFFPSPHTLPRKNRLGAFLHFIPLFHFAFFCSIFFVRVCHTFMTIWSVAFLLLARHELNHRRKKKSLWNHIRYCAMNSSCLLKMSVVDSSSHAKVLYGCHKIMLYCTYRQTESGRMHVECDWKW